MNRNFASALLGLVMALLPACAAAQGGGTAWDPPANVSRLETNSADPCIVADPWGMVHLFWDESLENASSPAGDVIFYSRWDGAAWSKPVDVLMSLEGSRAEAVQPRAVALPDGRLALVWAGGFGDRIYFSTAPADAAGSARAWSLPRALVADRPQAAQPRIALDSLNVLHLLYLHYEGEFQGLWHLSSADGGRTWTAPRRLPGTYSGKPNVLVFHPDFAIDGSGTLHAAWGGSVTSGGFPPDGIHYSRSEDGGDTWSDPVMLATGPYSFPVLGTRGASEVHLMWSGTQDQRRKFYEWSVDGGRSWSQPGAIGELGGMQGSAQMAVDGDGVLHLAFVSSHPEHGDSLFHSHWLGGGWSEPELLLKGVSSLTNMQYAAAAVGGGNALYAAVMQPLDTEDGVQFDIFALRGLLPARAVAASPLPPTATPQATSTPPAPMRVATASPAASSPVASTSWPAAQPPTYDGSGTGVIVAGIVPVLLVMAVVAIVWSRRRR